MHDFKALVRSVWERSFDGENRRYHRFRTADSGSTLVADCIGSNLRCAHEWGWCEGILDDPSAGRLVSPDEIVNRAKDCDATAVRVTGMEPVMHDRHLLQLAETIPESMTLRIETNGMLLGGAYTRALTDRCDCHVRLSFKGSDPEQFSKLARVDQRYFQNQVQAFHAIRKAECSIELALAGVYDEEDATKLGKRLIDDGSIDITAEPLRLCPENEQKLEEAGFDVAAISDRD